jgi:heme exporter protein A
MPAPRTAATEPAIVLDGLVRHFGERVALREVTLSLNPGATLAVLGPNGAGKSTLLRILATLLRPHGGTANVLGEPLPRNGYKVRARIGLLAHEPLLYRDLTARENLTYHARLHSLDGGRVEELLQRTQMSQRADEPIRTLSQGMVQRLAIARATLHQPQLLLLDEPRANLDPGAHELIEPLIGRTAGVTRVITSHDPAAALEEADLVVGLRDGRQAFVARSQDTDARAIRALYA